ncbi:MAG: hypothetical protein ACRDHG_05760 [Anaerolineales bacterium]
MALSSRLSRVASQPLWLLAGGLAVLGIALKLALLAMGSFPFHADEAVVGLMARHILQGRWPAFFYGQAYMGSLDASLVALAFKLIGESVGAIRAVQILLYGGTILTTVWLAKRVSSNPALPILAGTLMAVPTVNVTLYTTVSLGGYGEALLIGNLLLLLALEASRAPQRTVVFAVWAGLAGLGFWAFGLTLVYSVPSGILIIRTLSRLRRSEALGRAALIFVCGLAGAWPWIWSVGARGAATFVNELMGSAIVGSSPAGLFPYLAAHGLNLLLFGSTVIFGLRPPWEIRWLAWPLLPVAVLFWLAAMGLAAGVLWRERPLNSTRWLLTGVAVCVVLGFWLTPFGADPSGRYFLPLAIPLAIGGAELVLWLARHASVGLAVVGLAGVVGFNLWGTVESAVRNPPGITTQFGPETQLNAKDVHALIPALEGLREQRGYTNYWVAYPLAFLSGEQLVFVPQLPYHRDLRYTPRDDRYAPYNGMVESSGRVAYITSLQPELDRAIRAGLAGIGVSWKETTVGTLRIFYQLSDRVAPAQLELQAVNYPPG